MGSFDRTNEFDCRPLQPSASGIEGGKAKSRGATQSAVAVSLLCGGLISPLHYHPSPLYFFPLSLPDLLFAGLISLGQFPPAPSLRRSLCKASEYMLWSHGIYEFPVLSGKPRTFHLLAVG